MSLVSANEALLMSIVTGNIKGRIRLLIATSLG
jgi:hypothetical protein